MSGELQPALDVQIGAPDVGHRAGLVDREQRCSEDGGRRVWGVLRRDVGRRPGLRAGDGRLAPLARVAASLEEGDGEAVLELLRALEKLLVERG